MMKNVIKTLRARVAVAVMVAVGSAGVAQAQDITGAGASFPAPVYSKWAAEYNKATGVKVKLFHPIPPCETLELEVGNGDRYPVQLVWCREDQAGFRFPGEIDIAHLIDDNRSRFPKRQIRLRVDHMATLHVHGLVSDVVVRDISQQGACLECDQRLMLRQPVRIELAGFPPIFAKVCWRQQPRYGLVFENGFLLDELAHNLMKLHEPGVPKPYSGNMAVGQRYPG